MMIFSLLIVLIVLLVLVSNVRSFVIRTTSLRSHINHKLNLRDWIGVSETNFVTKSDHENDLKELKNDFKGALTAFTELYEALDKKVTVEEQERENYKNTLLKSVNDITKFLQDIDKIYDNIKENNNKIIQEKIRGSRLLLTISFILNLYS